VHAAANRLSAMSAEVEGVVFNRARATDLAHSMYSASRSYAASGEEPSSPNNGRNGLRRLGPMPAPFCPAHPTADHKRNERGRRRISALHPQHTQRRWPTIWDWTGAASRSLLGGARRVRRPARTAARDPLARSCTCSPIARRWRFSGSRTDRKHELGPAAPDVCATQGPASAGYREQLVTDELGQFVRFNRIYDGVLHRRLASR